jgi:hypothetical protein
MYLNLAAVKRNGKNLKLRERQESDMLDPDPDSHQSNDPDPHKFADVKAKCMEQLSTFSWF